MVAVKVTDREGQVHTLKAAPGSGLMELLRDNNLDIEAICGGCCSCATCHIFIGPKWAAKVPPRTSSEDDLLIATQSYRPDESRLSCQIRLTADLDGLEVAVAAQD
jgi:ferredoxin, 2Fe-2S